jgi:hypothetical protein
MDSRKMDWLACAAYARDLIPADFKVAFVVMQHANEKTHECFPSEQTIADKCGLSERHVRRSLKRLCDKGWLKSRRTRDANRYTVLFNNVNRILDNMIVDREIRKAERKRKPKVNASPTGDSLLGESVPLRCL